MKLDYPALQGTAIEAVSYTLGLGKIGSFSFNMPASHPSTQYVAAGQRLWIYDSTEGLVFKGKIHETTYQVDSSNRKILAVSGPSVAVELQQRTVGLGLQWEDVAFSTAVNDILDDTDWTAGEIDSAVNVPARRMDARQKWDALLALADIYQMLVREDNINTQVDMGAFGEASGLFLTNNRSDIITLDDDPTTIPITSLRVLARANDIVNRVYPVGQIQGLGGAVLTLSGVSSDNPVTTRLYLETVTAPSISPTFSSAWEDTSSAVRRVADVARGSATNLDMQVNPASTTNPSDILRAQWIYGPIGAQTISGNVKAQFLADESNADANSTLQMLIRVVASDGTTVRGTLLSHGTYGNELGTTTRNTTFPSTALSSLDALDGDYIVIEVGFRHSATIGTNRQSTLRAVQNDGTADLPEDETTTDTSLNPWIEFSTYIVPQLTADTTYEVQSATLNGITHYYLEDAASVAAYGLRDRVLNIKDILPLGLSLTALAQASATLYSVAVTYLQRHKDPQYAYEVECVGLRHMKPNGTPYFEVGDKLTLDYVGTVTDEDGTIREDLRVRADLYIMSAQRTYGPAGESTWKLTVSTIARELPNDGDLIAAMLSEIGVAKISPLGFFTFANQSGEEKMRLDEYGIQLATKAVESAAIYGVEEFLANPSTATTIWKLVGTVNAGLGSSSVALSAINSSVTLADGVDPRVLIKVEGEYMGVFLADEGAGDGRGPYTWFPPISAFSLAKMATTISSGNIIIANSFAAVDPSPTAAGGFVVVDTEASAASDNLDNIYYVGTSTAELRDGQIVVISAADSARTVVLTESGNLKLAGGSMSLDNAEDTCTLVWRTGIGWCEIARSNNGV